MSEQLKVGDVVRVNKLKWVQRHNMGYSWISTMDKYDGHVFRIRCLRDSYLKGCELEDVKNKFRISCIWEESCLEKLSEKEAFAWKI